MKTPSAVVCRLSRVRQTSIYLWLCSLVASWPLLGAPAIPNPSFEANTFNNPPGTIAGNSPITGWTASDNTRVGINPAGGQNVFADNSTVPNGTRVAFLQSVSGVPTTLSTTVTGLIPGRHYRIQFRASSRAATPGLVTATYRIDGGVPVGFTINNLNTPGQTADPYDTITILFTATAATAPLEIGTAAATDRTLLIDHFVITEPTLIVVSNLNNDGPGSLRQAMKAAGATPAFNLITFLPGFSGKSIDVVSSLEVDLEEASGVVIDAASLPKGLTLRNASGFSGAMMKMENAVILRGLNFEGGVGNGGACRVNTVSAVTISRCTFVGNGGSSTQTGGAIMHDIGHLVLSQCTLTGNASNNLGGAVIANTNTTTVLDHCTVTQNQGVVGGGIHNSGKLFVTNSIVAGNTATGSADIHNTGSVAVLTRAGANIIQVHNNTSGAISTGPAAINAAPLVDALADNGGATHTMALQPSSPARNASVGSNFLTDQRNLPVQGVADIGAYDVQRGVFNISSPATSFPEANSNILYTVARSNGFEGAATVRFSTVAGTAAPPGDFTAVSDQILTFTDGDVSENFLVSLLADAVVESNESFTVALNTPSVGPSLGVPSTQAVIIRDPSSTTADTTKPSIPLITSPAANANVKLVNNLLTITITGTATDNKGVDQVQVRVSADGGAPTPFVQAVLSAPDATSTQWTASFSFAGSPTKVFIEVSSTDGAGNNSAAFATRTVKLLHPLAVRLLGNGTVTAGFAPLSFRQIGLSHTITATPVAGSIFVEWLVQGATLPSLGLTPGDLLRPSLTFQHRGGLVLTARFVPSPFTSEVVGTFNGLMLPDGATPSSVSSEGLVNFTVTSTGAFSATLQIDAQVFRINGTFGANGTARFGTGRSELLRLARPGKPPYELRCDMTFPVPTLTTLGIDGSLVEVDFGGNPVGESEFQCSRASFNGTTAVAPASLQGLYSVILKPEDSSLQPAGVNNVRLFPQGTGIANLTVARTGVVTLTNCTLADGTTGVTASTFLTSSNECSLFIPLYSRKGFLRVPLEFSNLAASDVSNQSGIVARWSRPFIHSQYYPEGWEEVIRVAFLGAKYTATTGASVMRALDGSDAGTEGDPLQAPDLDGNVLLQFTQGQLEESLDKWANLSAVDAVTKVPFNDPTFTMAVSRGNGFVTGTFRHTDFNTIPFRGIVYQKGTIAGAHGFFLTKQPVPINYSGESGNVRITGAP